MSAESLGVELGGEHVHPGDVAAGACETRDHARFDQALAAPKRHDDGDGRRCLLRRDDRWRTHRDDDVDRRPDEVSGQLRKSVEIVLGRANLESRRLPVDVAKLAQRSDQGRPWDLCRREKTDSPYLPRGLRVGRVRRTEEQKGGENSEYSGGHRRQNHSSSQHCGTQLVRPTSGLERGVRLHDANWIQEGKLDRCAARVAPPTRDQRWQNCKQAEHCEIHGA